jgi:hypothetical protein
VKQVWLSSQDDISPWPGGQSLGHLFGDYVLAKQGERQLTRDLKRVVAVD